MTFPASLIPRFLLLDDAVTELLKSLDVTLPCTAAALEPWEPSDPAVARPRYQDPPWGGGQGSTKIHKFSYKIYRRHENSVENHSKSGNSWPFEVAAGSFVTLSHSSPMAYGECWALLQFFVVFMAPISKKDECSNALCSH